MILSLQFRVLGKNLKQSFLVTTECASLHKQPKLSIKLQSLKLHDMLYQNRSQVFFDFSRCHFPETLIIANAYFHIIFRHLAFKAFLQKRGGILQSQKNEACNQESKSLLIQVRAWRSLKDGVGSAACTRGWLPKLNTKSTGYRCVVV